MYYFFIPKNKLDVFKAEFEKTKLSIEKGKTPVFSEARCARTNLIEALPHYLLQGFFVVIGALLLSKINMNETLKLAIVLLVNGVCSTIASSLFVFVKNSLRIKMLKKMGLPCSEENIAVLESLEYQSV